MNEDPTLDPTDSVGMLFDADRSGRHVRVTMRAIENANARTVEGRPVAYRLSHDGHSVVVRASADDIETELRVRDIVRVEIV